MSQSVEQVLEFPQLAGILRRHLASPLGARELEKLRPLDDRREAERQLGEVAEAIEYLLGDAPLRFQGLHDASPATARLAIEGAALEPLEIFHLLELLDRAGDVQSVLLAARARFPRLAARVEPLGEFRPLLRELAGKILPDGTLDDHASGALRRLRREIAEQRQAVQASLERFVKLHGEEGILQEDYVTIRNERLVVPVISGQKRRIEGVIHGTSSTGHTLFVEPLETIELNNHLVRLAEQEQRETRRILREMTARLAPYADAITAAIDTLAALEWIFARAGFAREFGATIPSFSPSERPRLHLAGARHPLLEDLLRRRGGSTVPASLTLDAGRRVLIISGPNTGGKTVALKTVGLLALMAQAALPVPAAEAEFPWFEQVLADIGDYSSIQESLSTFSAHVTTLRDMIERATAGSLVLIDELGAATDPQEGGALGVAVVDHFHRAGAFTLVSTHLPAMKIYGANTAGVLNASLGFDEKTLAPDYRLQVGLPGPSAGLDIAQRLGLPAAIIERARQALTSHDLEAAEFLRQLHEQTEQQRAAAAELDQERRQLARRQADLEREAQKRTAAKLKELERRLEAVLAKFAADSRELAERIAAETASRKASSEVSRRTARLSRQAREEFEATVLSTLDEAQQGPPAPPAVAEGARVRLRGVAAPALVRRKLGQERLEVEIGQMKMQVALDDVLEVLTGPASRLPHNVRFQPAPRAAAPLTEINVIGATAEEARDRVDKFLDTAVVSGAARLRIIHGSGMGVLRRTLWKMFASHPHVGRYYQAEQQEGGAGATIVELRMDQ